MRRGLLVILAVAFMAGCGAGGSDADDAQRPTTTKPTTTTTTSPQADPFTLGIDLITGSTTRGIWRDGGLGTPCSTSTLTTPDDEFAAFKPEAQVVLKDGEGKTLGTGTLGVGSVESITPDESQWLCQWEVDLGDIPVADFYVPTVGGKELETLTDKDRQGQEGGPVFVAIYE